MTAALAASGLAYSVGSTSLVKDVELAVDFGELVAIVGPNGAGKTTLLRLLGGDLSPTAGSVEAEGRPIANMNAADLAGLRAYLGSDRTAGIPFSVEDIVTMGAWQRPVDGSEIDAALRAMDVAALRHRVVGSLSSGEHTRVELARILVQASPILLLDEPLTALDIAHQEMVMQHLQATARGGGALALVLHDLNAAAAYADRIVLMAGGSVAAVGPPSAVLDAALLSEVYGLEMQVHTLGTRTVVVPAG